MPFLPSEHSGRHEARFFRFLEDLASRYELKCIPEGPPTAARLAEAALASKGVKVYALGKPPLKAELDAGIRAVITENHSAPVVLVCGLELINRHLFQLRLFAQDRKFAALLLPQDLHALRYEDLSVSERLIRKNDLKKTLSNANAVFCCEEGSAQLLQKASDCAVLGLRQGLRALEHLFRKPATVRLGLALLPQAAGMAGQIAAMLKGSPAKLRICRVRDLAEFSRRVSEDRETGRWLLAFKSFTCSRELPAKLLFMSELFRDAGAVMPAVLRKLPGRGPKPDARLLAEAFALSRRGLFREPFYIQEPTLACVSREAFIKTGGSDPRLHAADYAFTDLCLRMYQAGHRSLVAEDLAVFCREEAPLRPGPERQEERETLVRKWGMESLKFMELLISELQANER